MSVFSQSLGSDSPRCWLLKATSELATRALIMLSILLDTVILDSFAGQSVSIIFQPFQPYGRLRSRQYFAYMVV
ncbi:hypothetical protein HUJ04_013577 [Dendroctonus ponderosae]|nr:hypothetical protein HUJ04_013577 [Dendroctonus ponderosae]